MPRIRKYGTRYPWRKWFLRRKIVLEKGKHYFCRADTFAQMVRAAARRHRPEKVSVSIEISESGDSMTVKIKREE